MVSRVGALRDSDIQLMKATAMKRNKEQSDAPEFDEFENEDFEVDGTAYDDDDDDDDDEDEDDSDSPYHRIDDVLLTESGKKNLYKQINRVRDTMKREEKGRFEWEDYDL